MKSYFAFAFCCSLLLAGAHAHVQQVAVGNDTNDVAILTEHHEESSPRTKTYQLRGTGTRTKEQSSRGLFLSTYKLQNFQNNLCVGFDSSGGTPIKGTKAVFEPCASAPSFVYGGPDGRQLVVLFKDADYKKYKNDMCLDSIGNISLQPCRDHFSQIWLPSQVEGGDVTRRSNVKTTYYRFFNFGAGKWLDSDMKLVKEDAANVANERQWFGGLDATFIGSVQGPK